MRIRQLGLHEFTEAEDFGADFGLYSDAILETQDPLQYLLAKTKFVSRVNWELAQYPFTEQDKAWYRP